MNKNDQLLMQVELLKQVTDKMDNIIRYAKESVYIPDQRFQNDKDLELEALRAVIKEQSNAIKFLYDEIRVQKHYMKDQKDKIKKLEGVVTFQGDLLHQYRNQRNPWWR